MRYDLTEKMNELFLAVGIGEFSLSKYLCIVLAMATVMCFIPYSLAVVRGAGRNVAKASVRDVLLGVACAMGVITFPGFFFFVGRGYLTALTARS